MQFFRYLIFTLLLGSAVVLHAAEQAKADKVERLYQYFNLQESLELRAQQEQARMAAAINAKAEQTIANLPKDAATQKGPKVREAAARCIASIQELPEAGRLWKSFMSEQLTEQELDVALTFFLSPAGGKFMGTKGVADSIVNTSLSKYANEHLRPALVRFEADLQDLNR